jgi:hypothetical protein
MVRSGTRRSNILTAFGRPLCTITEVAKRLMDNILGVADICHSLNHVHEIGSIRKMLHGIIHGPPQLIPNEVKDTKSFFIRCHPMEKTWSIISQSRNISNLRSNSGTKELIEIVVVGIKFVRLALNGQISARKHKGELLGLVLVLIVHGECLSSLEPRPKSLEKVM